MIKLCNFKTSVYNYKGSLGNYSKKQLLNAMSPTQRLILEDVEWIGRQHPRKSEFVEIYVDPDAFPKNKLLLAQIVFG
jgi:hypothetical protein